MKTNSQDEIEGADQYDQRSLIVEKESIDDESNESLISWSESSLSEDGGSDSEDVFRCKKLGYNSDLSANTLAASLSNDASLDEGQVSLLRVASNSAPSTSTDYSNGDNNASFVENCPGITQANAKEYRLNGDLQFTVKSSSRNFPSNESSLSEVCEKSHANLKNGSLPSPPSFDMKTARSRYLRLEEIHNARSCKGVIRGRNAQSDLIQLSQEVLQLYPGIGSHRRYGHLYIWGEIRPFRRLSKSLAPATFTDVTRKWKRRLVVLCENHCICFGNRNGFPKGSLLLDSSVLAEMVPIEQGRCCFEVTAGSRIIRLSADSPEEAWSWVEDINDVVHKIESLPRGWIEIQSERKILSGGNQWVRRFAMLHKRSLTIHTSTTTVHNVLRSIRMAQSTLSTTDDSSNILCIIYREEYLNGKHSLSVMPEDRKLAMRPVPVHNREGGVLSRVWVEAMRNCITSLEQDVQRREAGAGDTLGFRMNLLKISRIHLKHHSRYISRALRRWLIHIGVKILLEDERCHSKKVEEDLVSCVKPSWMQVDLTQLLNCCARQFRRRNQFQKATALIRLALLSRESTAGFNHPSSARTLNNLGMTLDLQGEHSEAEVIYRRALHLNTELWGPVHTETATTANNLAGALFNQGRYEEAESIYQYAYQICIPCFGTDHSRTRSCKRNQALCEQYAKRACIRMSINDKVLIRKADVKWAPSVFTINAGGKTGSPTRRLSSTKEATFRMRKAVPFTAHVDLANEVKDCACLIMRGLCPFTEKVKRAAKAGASLVVVINHDYQDKDALVEMGSIEGFRASIPVVLVSQNDGARLLTAIREGSKLTFSRRNCQVQNIWFEENEEHFL